MDDGVRNSDSCSSYLDVLSMSESLVREMARLPASRMVYQPKWPIPDHPYLSLKAIKIKASDLLCLCFGKMLFCKTQSETVFVALCSQAVTRSQSECSSQTILKFTVEGL